MKKLLCNVVLFVQLLAALPLQASYITKPTTGGGGGGGTWGSITGTLSDQTDLADALALKVFGPATSTTRALATFSDTTGKTLLDNPLATVDSSGNITANALFSGAFEGASSAGFVFGTAQPYESINFANLTNDGILTIGVGEYGNINLGISASAPNTISIGSTNTSTTVFGPMFFGYADVDFDGSDVKNIFTLKVNNGVRLADADKSDFVTLKAANTVTGYDLFFPDAQGSGALQNDGAGNLSWGGGSGSAGDLTVTSPILVSDGTGAVLTDVNIAIQPANAGQAGALSAADWTTFNGKQASGNYMTALTGEVTASGPGSSAATLSTTAVTGKALTGFVSGAGTVSATDTILTAVNKLDGNIAGKQATGNYVTALTGEVTASGPGSVAATLSTTAVTGKALTGYSSGAGTISASDTILTAINKLNGNALILPSFYFGDGVDGALTISAGTTTLTRDTYYTNVTITGTGSLNPAGFRVFISGTLDLTNAPANAITGTGSAGGATATAAGGSAGAALAAGTLGSGGAGAAGAAGGTAAGGTGTAAGTQLPANGGTGGDGNTGGTGTSGSGGGGGTGGALSFGGPFNRISMDLVRGASLYIGGCGGGGGGGGGGDGTQSGGGGGGAGGGRPVFIAANIVSRGGSTTAGAISSEGGVGGNGATPVGGARGGGAGGGGGGGGWVYMIIGSLSGSTGTNVVSVSGGTGGNGGNATTTGTGGKGGAGGAGGRYTILNLSTGVITSAFGSTGSAGGNNSGATGGTGGAGNSTRVNL